MTAEPAGADGDFGSAQYWVKHIRQPVRFADSVRNLQTRGTTHFVEVGPGKVLCGLIRQIDRSSACVNVEDEASLQKTANNFSSASPKPD